MEDANNIPVVLHSTKIMDASELQFFSDNAVTLFPKQSLTLPDPAMRIKELLATLVQHVPVIQ